jgi:hypothetical protein
MVQSPIIQASDVTLYEVEKRFGLQSIQDEAFFQTWLNEAPELTKEERHRLDRVKQQYLYLEKRPVLEEIVKMVVLSPLLDLAGFYDPPFFVTAEEAISLEDDVNGDIIRGKIDILVLQDKFWFAVIETKRPNADVMISRPQILTYMMASHHFDRPIFGLMTNGREAVFIQLKQQPTLQYSLSKSFSLSNPGNEFYEVLRGLKVVGQMLNPQPE